MQINYSYSSFIFLLEAKEIIVLPYADTKIMRKYKAAPHPFIIEPLPEKKRGYKTGYEITFGLTLIGGAIDYLPYFLTPTRIVYDSHLTLNLEFHMLIRQLLRRISLSLIFPAGLIHLIWISRALSRRQKK